MKKMLFCLAIVLLLSFGMVAEAETVAQMTYIVKMPDVIREGKYTGEVQDGVPHGYGAFVTQNSAGVEWHYIGEWENGNMTGNGGQYWNNGRCTVGSYVDGNMICGNIHAEPNQNAWINYQPNEHGCYEGIEYRSDGSVLFDGCINAGTGKYHKGTVYTKDGKVFFSGEIGEGFNWNLLLVE